MEKLHANHEKCNIKMKSCTQNRKVTVKVELTVRDKKKKLEYFSL